MTRSNFIDKEKSEWEIGLSLSLAFVVQDVCLERSMTKNRIFASNDSSAREHKRPYSQTE